MTKAEILEQIADVHAQHFRDLRIKHTPPIVWHVESEGESKAEIHWAAEYPPEILVRPSWAELSFAVMLRIEDVHVAMRKRNIR